MSYKIAAATTDGTQIDLSFGEADCFWIYEVDGDGSFQCIEKREVQKQQEPDDTDRSENRGCQESRFGCHGSRPGRPGCAGKAANQHKLTLVEDCRCVLCRQIGFPLRKLLARRAVSVFEIEYGMEAALTKIISYYDRVDHHQNLRQV